MRVSATSTGNNIEKMLIVGGLVVSSSDKPVV